jgi:putative inorganic carbon (hco3(-)) transporter
MYLNKIKNLYPTLILVAVLVAVSLAITYVIVNNGTSMGPMIIVALVGVSLVAAVLRDYRIGFYVLLLMGIFMFYIERILNSGFPFGTVYDGLAMLTFAAVFISNAHKRDWSLFKNPITIFYLIVTLYQVMQVVNPSAVSQVAWLVAMRNNTSILLYVVCFQLFSSLDDVKKFTKFWLALAFLCALYGFYQEFAGLTSFEHDWVYSSPDRLALYYIWGKMRKFSFLSDPSAYGLFVAMGALAFLVLAMGPFKIAFRATMAFCGFFTLVAMSYSGTRTAFAMVAVGIVFYVILSLNNRKVMLATIAAGFFGAIIFFGPFYGGTINRIRSTFNPDEDPSMVVRDQKRVRLQEYIMTHPIGGGLYTTGQNGLRYSSGHELAQGWDADSGYLLIGLELGPIGLVMFMALFVAVMVKGINNYFAMNDPLLRTLILVYLVPFFALSVAHYTQDALFTKPMNLIVIAAYALVIKLPSFERKLYSVDLL